MFEHVVRTTYFDSDFSVLIAEAAAPVLEQLHNSSSARGYLRTHWARGPHLDCVLAVENGDAGARQLDRVRSSLADWVERHPSGAVLPPDFLTSSQRMADAEQWQGPILPFYENNSVFVVPNDRKALWSSERLGTAAARFHSEVLPDLVQLIQHKRQSRGVFLLAVARRLASVAGVGAPAEFDFWPLSLSAHAKLFLTAHPSMQATFESAWERLRRPALQSLGEVIGSSGAAPDLVNWSRAATDLNDRLRALQSVASETIVPVDVDNPLHVRETLGSTEQVASRLREMFDADHISAAFQSPLHQRFRIIINQFYESFATATISPVERALACFILSRVVREGYPAVAAAARANIIELAEATHA